MENKPMRTRDLAFSLTGITAMAFAAPAFAFNASVCDFTVESFGYGTSQTGIGINAANASCDVVGVGGTAWFQIPTGDFSVGTGLIEPFLTTQNNGNEAGFNTDAKLDPQKDGPKDTASPNPYEFDAKRGGAVGEEGFTNSLRLSQIPTVSFGGTLYREFLLDLNQTKNDSHLSLDVVRLFGGSDGDMATIYDLDTQAAAGFDRSGVIKEGSYAMSLIWSLDTADLNQRILLDYALCDQELLGACPKGSGRTYDMRMLIPDSLFGSYLPDSYIALYTSFGWAPSDEIWDPTAKGGKGGWVTRSFTTNDGFEEWAIRDARACASTDPACNPYETPEPGTLALLGLGLMGLGLSRRRTTA